MRYQALFPQDTRSSELASAWGLIFISFLITISGYVGLDDIVLRMYQHISFWAIIFGILGSLQLTTIAFYPKLEILRTITAWTNGTLWVWIGFSASQGYVAISDMAAICLGVANLYAFILNSLLIHHRWEA